MEIHASQAFRLMTEPKLKADKDAGKLGETAKTYIEELWLQDKYGYKEDYSSPETRKGIEQEGEAINMLNLVLGGDRVKNKQSFCHIVSSDISIVGVPDIILEDCIEDVKCSFTVKTFFNAAVIPAYLWQAQIYMFLLGIKKFYLRYCLVPTPDHIILELQKRVYYNLNCDETNEEYQKQSEQIAKNHDISTIPLDDRIKTFEIEYDPEAIMRLMAQIEKGFNYYNSLAL